jgi:integrase
LDLLGRTLDRSSEPRAGCFATGDLHAGGYALERIRNSGLYDNWGLIFATSVGTPINPENLVKRSFKPLLKKAGLPEIRFHDLRHTCATLLLGRGVHPKIVQELLGHATIAMTLDTYSHYLPSMGDQASGALRDAFE